MLGFGSLCFCVQILNWWYYVILFSIGNFCQERFADRLEENPPTFMAWIWDDVNGDTLILYAESIVSKDRSDFSRSWPRTLSRRSDVAVTVWDLQEIPQFFESMQDVEHRLEDLFVFCAWQEFTLTCHLKTVQDLAQYIQEEMYHFVLGPDMMERVRPGSRFRVFLLHWFLHSFFINSFVSLLAC